MGGPFVESATCVPRPETARGDAVQRDQAFPRAHGVMSAWTSSRPNASRDFKRPREGEDMVGYPAQLGITNWPFGLVI